MGRLLCLLLETSIDLRVCDRLRRHRILPIHEEEVMQYLIRIRAKVPFSFPLRREHYVLQEADSSGEAIGEARENFLSAEPEQEIENMVALGRCQGDDAFEIVNPDLRSNRDLHSV